ncbi:MAG: tyrosine-protein phosphatase [Porticoccaceae bacterium]|nr:tyrosine-protein phosphatase [Porticoccaceae bacterium]
MNDLSTRLVPLEGGCNFRDLGGYTTVDQRRIKPGKLYRSGVMSYFTAADKATLHALGVRTICDLRREDERSAEPTAWPVEVNLVAWDEEVPRGELSWLDSNDAEHAREVMKQTYRTMPDWLHNRLVGLFELLANNEVPLVFHCAAGKDRTGLSAALILHCLGVPRETIYRDYELTNHAVDLDAFLRHHGKARLGLSNNRNTLTTMDTARRQAILNADLAYLMAGLEQIEQDHDTLDNYLRDVLGVSDATQAEIRHNLLI